MTKRILYSFPLLLGTFFLGYSLVPQLRIIDTPTPEMVGTLQPITQVPEITAASNLLPMAQLEIIDYVTDLFEEPSKHSIRLLETGEFDAESFPVKNGETWLGLFEKNGEYSVRQTSVTISRPHDDAPKADVPGSDKPIFLVKNAPMVREGSVNSIFRGVDYTIVQNLEKRGITYNDAMTKIDKDFNETFQFDFKNYVLKVDQAKDKDGKKMLALFLSDGNTRQLLYAMPEEYCPSLGNMFWIGDLDRDGRPDIYCSLYDGEESGSSVLFLSSKAEKGSLMKKVAEFRTPGC